MGMPSCSRPSQGAECQRRKEITEKAARKHGGGRRRSGTGSAGVSGGHESCCKVLPWLSRNFVVQFKSGDIQTLYAERGDQETEEDGYLFFRNSDGEITYLFQNSVIADWREAA